MSVLTAQAMTGWPEADCLTALDAMARHGLTPVATAKVLARCALHQIPARVLVATLDAVMSGETMGVVTDDDDVFAFEVREA